MHTDLTGIFAKKGVVHNADWGTNTTPRNTAPGMASSAVDGRATLQPRQANTLGRAPRQQQMGRAMLPQKSPFDMRMSTRTAVDEEQWEQGPPSKRPRNDENHVPLFEILKTSKPSKSKTTGTSVAPMTSHTPARRAAAEPRSTKATKQARLKVMEFVDLMSSEGGDERPVEDTRPDVVAQGHVEPRHGSPVRPRPRQSNRAATSYAPGNGSPRTTSVASAQDTTAKPGWFQEPQKKTSTIQPRPAATEQLQQEAPRAGDATPAATTTGSPPQTNKNYYVSKSTTTNAASRANSVVHRSRPGIPAVTPTTRREPPSSPPVSVANHLPSPNVARSAAAPQADEEVGWEAVVRPSATTKPTRSAMKSVNDNRAAPVRPPTAERAKEPEVDVQNVPELEPPQTKPLRIILREPKRMLMCSLVPELARDKRPVDDSPNGAAPDPVQAKPKRSKIDKAKVRVRSPKRRVAEPPTPVVLDSTPAFQTQHEPTAVLAEQEDDVPSDPPNVVEDSHKKTPTKGNDTALEQTSPNPRHSGCLARPDEKKERANNVLPATTAAPAQPPHAALDAELLFPSQPIFSSEAPVRPQQQAVDAKSAEPQPDDKAAPLSVTPPAKAAVAAAAEIAAPIPPPLEPAKPAQPPPPPIATEALPSAPVPAPTLPPAPSPQQEKAKEGIHRPFQRHHTAIPVSKPLPQAQLQTPAQTSKKPLHRAETITGPSAIRGANSNAIGSIQTVRRASDGDSAGTSTTAAATAGVDRAERGANANAATLIESQAGDEKGPWTREAWDLFGVGYPGLQVPVSGCAGWNYEAEVEVAAA